MTNTENKENEEWLEAFKHSGTKAVECCSKLYDGIDPHSAESRKALLQLGYNLGRLAELTGLGRAVWDEASYHVKADRYDRLRVFVLEPLAAEYGQKF